MKETIEKKAKGYAKHHFNPRFIEQAFIAGYSEATKWVDVKTSPSKSLADKNGEIYVLASEDEACLTVEKVFYDPKDNTYHIPFAGQKYFAKWWTVLPQPPKN